MKRLLRAAVAGTTLLAGAGFATAQTTLFYGEAGPNRGARAEATNWFADQVAERTDGELTFDLQWGGALFKAGAALSGVADGIADAGTIIGVYFPQEMVAYGIADLPINNPDAWVGMRATDEIMRSSDAIQQNLADMNLVYIGTYTTSAVHIGCSGTSIKTADDISGKKVRGVGAYGKTFGDFGANLVSMSIYDAYQGLDTGLIDCSQGYSYAVAALKQQEVMDLLHPCSNWGQVGALGLFMNKDVHRRAGPQAAQGRAEREAGIGHGRQAGRTHHRRRMTAPIEMMKEAGIEVIELPAAERDARWSNRARTYVDAWVERCRTGAGLDGAALLEAVSRASSTHIRARARQTRATPGNPDAS